MKCRTAERRLLDSFDRDLSGPDRAALTAHLDACPRCRGAAAEYEALRRRLASLPEAEPLPRFWERLEARIQDTSRAEAGTVWLRLWVRAIPVSLSMIAGFLAATVIFLPARQELSTTEALLLRDENPIVETRTFIEAERREDRDLMILFAGDERLQGGR